MRKYRKNIGFSLIELVVVVLITGILAAVGSVVYGKYLNRIRLAEALTTLDQLTKSQATYYMNHKYFRSFIVPSASGIQNIPSGGMKVRVDSSVLSIQNNVYNLHGYGPESWSEIGSPIPDNTMISFNYMGYSGRNDSQGNPINASMDARGIPFGADGIIAYGGVIMNPATTCTMCMEFFFKGANNLHKADKRWIEIAAIANLDNSKEDVVPNQSNCICSVISKYIETNDEGKMVTGIPVTLRNFGH